MNKLVIPSLLLGVVMIAGAFAFVPVQEASTVHLSGTTILGTNGIPADGFAADSIGVGDFITDAVNAESIAPDAQTEIQTWQITTRSDATINALITCTSTDSPFLVHYNISAIASGETITIAGTAVSGGAYTILGTAVSLGTIESGTIGGASGQTVTFLSSATTANLIVSIEAPVSATAAACTSA